MSQNWRSELRAWANQYVEGLRGREGILGVAIGGSLARGQEWRHSDLETGVLVEQRDQSLPYFNIDSGRGVEIIQLVRGELEEQVGLAERGDRSPLLNWPIQLWKCRVVYDPSGLLNRFKRQFDDGLFQPDAIAQRIADLSGKIGKALDEARGLLAGNRPAAALVRTRLAMNDAILALYWHYGELPRSQNRTDSRLRLLCRRHSAMPFYELYREIFALSDTGSVIKKTWPKVKEDVLAITRLWGARDFFLYAVDGSFAWRQNAGILTVYRLYVPIIGAPEQGLFAKLDDPRWSANNPDLLRFLGLANAEKEAVSALVERVNKTCVIFGSPQDI